jgi:hypothetical protein
VTNEKKLERARPAALGSAGVDVVLGDREYHVIPQRIGYLRSRFGVALAGIDTTELSSGSVVEFLGERVYAVLNVFIPDLMPKYEFLGFRTEEALEADEYEPVHDHSPSPTQVKAALLLGAEINEIDLLKHLGKLIGPELLQTWAQTVMIDSMKASLQTSVGPSGDTPGTTSGLSSPTSG